MFKTITSHRRSGFPAWAVMERQLIAAIDDAAPIFLEHDVVDEAGRFHVPFNYTDDGWTNYGPMIPHPPIHLWAASMADEDLQRLQKLRQGAEDEWRAVTLFFLAPSCLGVQRCNGEGRPVTRAVAEEENHAVLVSEHGRNLPIDTAAT